MAKEAVLKALKDAKINYDQVKQACVGYVYGDSTSGQRALYEVGMTGIPIYNVNNNCSTGSSALYLAKQLIETGDNDCVLALGFEKMEKGSLTSKVPFISYKILQFSFYFDILIANFLKFLISILIELILWKNMLKQ